VLTQTSLNNDDPDPDIDHYTDNDNDIPDMFDVHAYDGLDCQLEEEFLMRLYKVIVL